MPRDWQSGEALPLYRGKIVVYGPKEPWLFVTWFEDDERHWQALTKQEWLIH
jgi:hypothetical protein